MERLQRARRARIQKRGLLRVVGPLVEQRQGPVAIAANDGEPERRLTSRFGARPSVIEQHLAVWIGMDKPAAGIVGALGISAGELYPPRRPVPRRSRGPMLVAA